MSNFSNTTVSFNPVELPQDLAELNSTHYLHRRAGRNTLISIGQSVPKLHAKHSEQLLAALHSVRLTVRDIDRVVILNPHLNHPEIARSSLQAQGGVVPVFPNAEYVTYNRNYGSVAHLTLKDRNDEIVTGRSFADLEQKLNKSLPVVLKFGVRSAITVQDARMPA